MNNSVFMNICNVTRFSNQHFIEPDRDSDHTLRMQLYVLDLYDKFGDKIPVRELTYRCLVHDLDESVCCDIPRDIKYHDNSINREIKRVSEELLRGSGVSDVLINDIETAKHKGDEWDTIIKYLDMYDAMCTLIKEYRIQNNPKLKVPLTECRDYLLDAQKSLLAIKDNDIRHYVMDTWEKILGEANNCLR